MKIQGDIHQAILKNELGLLLRGLPPYGSINEHADMPTNPTTVFQNILRDVKETDSYEYWKSIENELLLLPSDSVGTWLSIYYLSALLFAQQNKTGLNISTNKLISSIREGVDKNYKLLNQDRRWVGTHYQNGLMGDLERLVNNLSNRFGGQQLEELALFLQAYNSPKAQSIGQRHSATSEIKERESNNIERSPVEKSTKEHEKLVGIKLFFGTHGTAALLISNKQFTSFPYFFDLSYKRDEKVASSGDLLAELPVETRLAKINNQRSIFRELDKSSHANYTNSEEIGYLFKPLPNNSKKYRYRIPGNGVLELVSAQVKNYSLNSPHMNNTSIDHNLNSLNNSIDIPSKVRNFIYECGEQSIFNWLPEKGTATVNYKFRVLEEREQIEVTGTIHCTEIIAIELQSRIPELFQNPIISAPVILIDKYGKKSNPVTGWSGPGAYAITLPGFWHLIITCSDIYITEQEKETIS